MIKIKFKRLHPDAQLPKQLTELSGGWDVTCTEIEQLSDDIVVCKLGFALQPPPGYRIVLVPRSSLTKTKWIMQNSPGTGDADYTGEYQYRFRAIPIILYGELSYPKFPFNPGDRIGQIYLEEVIPIYFEETNEFEETQRGDGGFGSTGK
jgi:dUTP pyrophosphatase